MPVDRLSDACDAILNALTPDGTPFAALNAGVHAAGGRTADTATALKLLMDAGAVHGVAGTYFARGATT